MARDDSVIRGSLIACMIFLVFSIALNLFLWRWGDTQSNEATTAGDRLRSTQAEVAAQEDKINRMKAMLGIGAFTPAQIEEMKQSASEDPDMQLIEDQFAKHMELFGPDFGEEQRSYASLPNYLADVVFNRNKQYADAEEALTGDYRRSVPR